MKRVLIVDDDPVHLRLTGEVARSAGYEPILSPGGEEALAILRGNSDLVAIVLDLVMPDLDGMGVMDAMAAEGLATPVIVQTAHAGLDVIASATRRGAIDFFVKPVAPERLVVALQGAQRLRALEQTVCRETTRNSNVVALADLIAAPAEIARLNGFIGKAAKSDLPVMLEGESGTGKEMVARIIHARSDRASRPFIILDCSAMPSQQLETALFGTSRGVRQQAGAVHQVQGGSLLLREAGHLPLDLQDRLLRLIDKEENRALPVGRGAALDARVIVSSTSPLLNLVKAGHWRENLFYRLNVLPITLAPLRERKEDIARLAQHFAARFGAETGRRIEGVSIAGLEVLAGFHWPGNIRQLQNTIFRAVSFSHSPWLDFADFPQILAQVHGRSGALRLPLSSPLQPVEEARSHTSIPEVLARPDPFIDGEGRLRSAAEVECALIAYAIEHHKGHMSHVARALKMGRSTLYRKLREYGLDPALHPQSL